MRKPVALIAIIVVWVILLSTGVVTVSAGGGPAPKESPASQPAEFQAINIGSPQEFILSKKTSQILIVGSPHEEPTNSNKPLSAP